MDLSAYVKTVDQRHMVAIGDQGFFGGELNRAGWPYHTSGDLDVARINHFPDVDVVTMHMYPGEWGLGLSPEKLVSWGDEWISDHVFGIAPAKPVIVEEINTLSPDARPLCLQSWLHEAFRVGAAGFIVYQVGGVRADGGVVEDAWQVFEHSASADVLRRASLEMRGEAEWDGGSI